ncbi:TPA: hypothetical protein G8Z49_001565 [Salmonella enterica]|uniref:Uncharacterized protein n=1 Tax=Salmonella enterica TaxID=28901 RepID=A0A761LWL9_SALER|nr:hypothetical protein [Salmonella enterica]HAG2305949.1 hypothetical protein [Salmonella enterica]HAG3176204.1 hypothetical protein [Salmonella enterica]HAG5133851.1 hypothetical protein [Salmonella enterica]
MRIYRRQNRADVFPAPAGINRQYSPDYSVYFRVPRASGDKPIEQMRHSGMGVCSPRQRG